jgi:hypothetical protein
MGQAQPVSPSALTTCDSFAWRSPDTLRMPDGRPAFVASPNVVVRVRIGLALIGSHAYAWGTPSSFGDSERPPENLQAGVVIERDGRIVPITFPSGIHLMVNPMVLQGESGTAHVVWGEPIPGASPSSRGRPHCGMRGLTASYGRHPSPCSVQRTFAGTRRFRLQHPLAMMCSLPPRDTTQRGVG